MRVELEPRRLLGVFLLFCSCTLPIMSQAAYYYSGDWIHSADSEDTTVRNVPIEKPDGKTYYSMESVPNGTIWNIPMIIATTLSVIVLLVSGIRLLLSDD